MVSVNLASTSAPNVISGIATPTLSQNITTLSDKVIAGYWLVKATMEVALPRGANIDKLLRGTGIFEDAITSHLMISVKQYTALLVNVQHYTKGKDVSFLIGNALASYWASSPLSVLAKSECLEDLTQQLLSQHQLRWCAHPLLSFRAYDFASYTLWIPELTIRNAKINQFALEIGFSTVMALCKMVTGRRPAMTFSFQCQRPRNVADYEIHLGLKTRFSSPINGMTIAKNDLLRPIESGSDHLAVSGKSKPAQHHFVDQSITTQWPQREIVSRISLPDYVRQCALSPHHNGLTLVAEHLNLSVATLKRKLNEFGVSYRQLSEEVKRNQAIVLLSLNKMTNEQTAGAMAMSDLPNFRRVIKRLTGNTPSELRALIFSDL
ncbi:AraC family transcriptional regulator [Alteromonas sp. D210916BOD_24]|uniref:helix-turn-helix domain-containing protein n=1 Tax=Alteromonas sp. D210916BOD_24 TaxID=3157618 RepID=UPI00399D222C